MGSYKYPLLNDPDWLKQKYLLDGLSTREVARMAGAKTCNSARQALIRNGIPVRSVRDGLVLGRNPDGFVMATSVVTGCLLGDANLTCYNRQNGTSMPYFKKRNKGLDHIEFVAQQLFPTTWRERITSSVEHMANGDPYPIHALRSLSHEELRPLFDAWYPQDGAYRKRVPRDIPMDQTVLLHWFMDDGNAAQRSGRSTRQIIVSFASESFTKEDQEFLAARLYESFGFSVYLHRIRFGTGWRIELPQSQADLFYQVIGPCPVPSMAHKWK